jgi:uncharacterized protein
MTEILYAYDMPPASHWSLRVRRGTCLTLTDNSGGANVGMLFYNPEDLLERYNAPDTLKCQHTFKLTRGNCLYSDMGRIFCSIVEDSFAWHDTVCGNMNKSAVEKRWGKVNYQQARNEWQQNGYDSFLVELAKYGLGVADMAANINWFSKVVVDANGNMSLSAPSKAGDKVMLRFEMDTLVVMHTCPHPLNYAEKYPRTSVRCEITKADTVRDDDYCLNYRPENKRGFENNRLYYF